MARLALLAVLAFGTACGSAGPKAQEETRLDPGLRPPGLILMPVALAIPGTSALDIVSRTNDLARWLMQRTDLPLIGPYDYTLNKPADEAQNAMTDTDLLARTDALHADVRNWLVIHVLVTENRASSERDIVDTRVKDPKKPNTWRQRSIEAKVRVDVSVLDARRGAKLAGLVYEADDDPASFEPGGDPRPGITRIIGEAMVLLLAGSGSSLYGTGSRRTRGVGIVDSVPAVMAWTLPDSPSWNEQHQKDQDIVREAAVLSMFDRLAPNLDMRTIFAAARNSGLLVQQVQPGLELGDIIVSLGERPLSAAYQLDRGLQASPPAGCTVSVMRKGQKVDVTLQWPALPTATPPAE
ncbi:MAG: hypothetical protein EXR79_09975 [Myxococcales bacterium]|nr:hypothetical protein [Myxococcales bacterium]